MPLFGRSGGSSLFSKVLSGGKRLIGGIGGVARNVGGLANRAGGIFNQVGTIASNPLVQSLADRVGLGGVAQKVAGIANTGSALAGQVGNISQKVSDITSPATFQGQNPVPALRNLVERAKDIKQDVGMLVY